MAATETQKRYLQAADPLIRRALRDPDFDPNELKSATLTPNQREAITDGIMNRSMLIGNLCDAIKGIDPEDRELVFGTAVAMQGEEPKVPLRLVQIAREDQERAWKIVNQVKNLTSALDDAVKGGQGAIIRRYLFDSEDN